MMCHSALELSFFLAIFSPLDFFQPTRPLIPTSSSFFLPFMLTPRTSSMLSNPGHILLHIACTVAPTPHSHSSCLCNTPACIYSQVQLKLPLQLKWRRGPDMPFAMSGPVQAVQMQGTLYVGGGLADGDSGNLIMTYVVSADKWVTLPPCSTRWFAMTAIKNHLVLVAGQGRGGYSKALHVWRADNKKWTHSYPDMTTPRHSCSVFFYKPWLGG